MKKLILIIGIFFIMNKAYAKDFQIALQLPSLGKTTPDAPTDQDQETINALKQLLQNTPLAVRKEIEEYRSKFNDLQLEAQYNFEMLSTPAKDFLKKEHNYQKDLSDKGRQILKNEIETLK